MATAAAPKLTDKGGEEIRIGCRVAEADFSYGDGAVESITVPITGDGFNVGIKWDTQELGGPPCQPKVAVVQQSISSCSVRLRSSFREAPSGRTGAVGGEPFSAALLHVGRPMTHGPVGALALLHLLGMHTEHMCAARAARERRHRRQVPRSGVVCAAAVAVPIAVLQQHAQSALLEPHGSHWRRVGGF